MCWQQKETKKLRGKKAKMNTTGVVIKRKRNNTSKMGVWICLLCCVLHIRRRLDVTVLPNVKNIIEYAHLIWFCMSWGACTCVKFNFVVWSWFGPWPVLENCIFFSDFFDLSVNAITDGSNIIEYSHSFLMMFVLGACTYTKFNFVGWRRFGLQVFDECLHGNVELRSWLLPSIHQSCDWWRQN